MSDDTDGVTAGKDEPDFAPVVPRHYEQFIRERLPDLLKYAKRIADSPEQGEDAMQEALIEAYRRWPDVSVMKDPIGWVLRVAQHQLYRLRLKQRRSLKMPQAASEDTISDPSDAFVEKSALGDAVRDLPPRLREVVGVRYTLDLDVREIADLFDLRESTVRGHLARAHAELRNRLTSIHQDDVQ